MKKIYESPEIQIKNFSLTTEILAELSNEDSFGSGNEYVEEINGVFRLNSSGFGW